MCWKCDKIQKILTCLWCQVFQIHIAYALLEKTVSKFNGSLKATFQQFSRNKLALRTLYYIYAYAYINVCENICSHVFVTTTEHD